MGLLEVLVGRFWGGTLQIPSWDSEGRTLYIVVETPDCGGYVHEFGDCNNHSGTLGYWGGGEIMLKGG